MLVKRVAVADDGGADAHLGADKKPAEHGDDSGKNVGPHMNEVDAHAIALGGLLAKADGAHLQTAARAIEPDSRRQSQRRE